MIDAPLRGSRRRQLPLGKKWRRNLGRKKALVVVAATAAYFATAAALPRAAQAQRPRIIECDSNRGRPGWCRTFGQGDVRLVRQLSRTPCILWDTWGPDPDGAGVWVRSGCRAQFAVSPWPGRPAVVVVPPRPGPPVVVVPPRPGPGWNGQGGRPATDGWSGEYDRPGQGTGGPTSRIVCQSRSWSYEMCPVRTQGRQFRLEQQMSNQPCIRGDNWGVLPGGLWVDRGCAGEFGMR